MTMLRFERAKRVGFREYKRADGTRSYFFCLDVVRDLFVNVGFTEVLFFYIIIRIQTFLVNEETEIFV